MRAGEGRNPAEVGYDCHIENGEWFAISCLSKALRSKEYLMVVSLLVFVVHMRKSYLKMPIMVQFFLKLF